MLNRLAVIAALAVVTAGCAEQATAERPTGRITVDGVTHTTQAVSCEQYEWLLVIEMTAEPAHARTLLQLGSEEPTVKTVSIANFDGFNGVAGEGVGSVEASAAEGTYTMTGTAEGSDQGNPGQTRTVPFRIEAPC
jgi:lipoprotein LpqH